MFLQLMESPRHLWVGSLPLRDMEDCHAAVQSSITGSSHTYGGRGRMVLVVVEVVVDVVLELVVDVDVVFCVHSYDV